ncbi:hypothetical protein Pst134EA_024118 [Puccinia striiformis f. sp. tritici]|uniref:hypothetical protein n=1 Tax=Puccinia striiformis f. sp. tritici TaxID=168172 RepID=UPI002007E53F|nr:hypothetical protein Pst134EA_024118 [Puccinia striiformis f. sp. tritici]KAH9453234.1 hypothetical protein Pst134EA_024118 [Puccinia striiformis f. sp. tritici]
MDSTNNQLNIPGSEPPGQSQPTNTRAMFTQENVEEILAVALARQAAMMNIRDGPNTHHQPIPAQNPTPALNQTPAAKKTVPPNKRSKLLGKATRNSARIMANRAQSEPPMASSTTPAKHTSSKKKAGLPSSPRKAASPGPKKAPHQMVTADFPPNFKDTKRCLFAHIRLLWGLVETRTVPPPANPEHIRSFCANFQTINEVQRYLEDSNSAALIANEDILTLKDARAGVTQVGKGFIHIDDGHISYIHAQLAKLGIRCWGPNLDEGPESLFNAACRIAALTIFQQIAVAGGYNFLNFNHNYKDDMLTFIRTYNHYVHHVLAKKYRAECKKVGSNEATIEKNNATRNRIRLRKARVKFGNRNEFPERYMRVLRETAAHSDDELDDDTNSFVIQTLGYRSNAASIFFRRLDLAMKAVQKAKGKASRMRARNLPIIPIPSKFTKVPESLPLDFYGRKWLSEIPEGQQRTIPDLTSVAFLPDPSKSLFPSNNPNFDPLEKLSDAAFNRKFLNGVLKKYRMKEIIEDDAIITDDSGAGSEDEDDDNENLENSTHAAQHNDKFLADGDWGNHYDDDDDDDDSEGGTSDEDKDEDMEDDDDDDE